MDQEPGAVVLIMAGAALADAVDRLLRHLFSANFSIRSNYMNSRSLLAVIFLIFAVLADANAGVTINDPAISSGYQPSYYINTAGSSPEIDVIGVYETRSDHSFGYHPTGTAHVHITGAASVPVNLVLSSYEPTQWILDGAGLSFVQSVLISSYNASTVIGVDSSKIQMKNLGAYAYAWPSSSGSSMVSAVQALYGAKITTFSGVYRATDFSVELVSAVPEPSPAMLLFCGLGFVGAALLRSKKISCSAA
jgi:hypothetical protein